MKTMTIYRALRKAMKCRDYYGRGYTEEKTAKYIKFDAQADRLHQALLRRIEAGDRAREALDELANWCTLDSPEGQEIISDILKDDQP